MVEAAEIKYLSNPDVGNIWAGWILNYLAEEWPVPTNVDVFYVIRKTGVSPKSGVDAGELLGHLISWMKKEGFVEGEGITFDNYVLNFTITAKTQDMLNRRPESLAGKSVRDALADAAKDVSKEAAKSQLSELFGQFIGGIIKSATT